MATKYLNPPVKEAVCEFRFPQEVRWDMAVAGILYEQIKEEYPEREQRAIQEVETHQEGPQVGQTIRQSLRMLFLNAERNRLVQVGDRLVSVNALRPYRSWEEDYFPRIEKVAGLLQKTVETDRFLRIGLRYMNLIEVPEGPVELEKYFEFRPYMGKRMPADFGAFFTGCIFSFPALEATCNAKLTNAVADSEGKVAFLLDLDFATDIQNQVPVEKALGWVREAHQAVEEVFEACIADDLRAIFNEGPNP